MRYKVREIDVLSALRTGLLVGLVVGILPVLAGILSMAWYMGGLVAYLSPHAEAGTVAEALLDWAVLWVPSAWWVYLIYILIGLILFGVIAAVLCALAALAYNFLAGLTEGLEIELAPPLANARAMPQPPSPAPPYAAMPQQAQPLQPPSYVPAAQRQPQQPPSYAQPLPAQPQGASPYPSTPQQQSRPASTAPVQQPAPQSAAPQRVAPQPASASGSGPRLALKSNPNQVWPITGPRFVIGSDPGSDFSATGLAPKHAEIRFDPSPSINAYLIYDYSNGQVWVNNRPVQRVNKLNNGFEVRVGPIELLFIA